MPDQLCADLDQALARDLASFGQIWDDLRQSSAIQKRPVSATLLLISAKFGLCSAKVRPVSTRLGLTATQLVQCSPEFGLILPYFGQHWTRFGQTHSSFDQLGARVDRVGAGFVQMLQACLLFERSLSVAYPQNEFWSKCELARSATDTCAACECVFNISWTDLCVLC